MKRRDRIFKPVKGVGRAIDNDRKRRTEQTSHMSAMRTTGVAEKQAAKSVLEQSSLDTFIADAEMSQATFEATRGERFREEGPQLVTGSTLVEAANLAEDRYAAVKNLKVPIPWRPQWSEDMDTEELIAQEGAAFLEWRRELARFEEKEGVVMTPYERNLDFWRQLWRCVEKSSLVVQILDARDPEFYRSQDLESYVKHFESKQYMLLLNKADFLTLEHRQRWVAYFKNIGVDILFFSALRELHRQERLPSQATEDADMPGHGCLLQDDPDVLDCTQLLRELHSRISASADGAEKGTVGFVGYPNVGKSSVINALFGAKKVSMSRTPGKTKHLQTLELVDPCMRLCDCPGLVFPSIVATKAHLVINGTASLDLLRDAIAPARLVVQKIGLPAIMEKYGVTETALRDGTERLGEDGVDATRSLLAGLASARQHFWRQGVPDEGWAAKKVLRDFCSGALLHCEEPPDQTSPAAAQPLASTPEGAIALAPDGQDSESDFSDLEAFLANESSTAKQPSRRRTRPTNKGKLRSD